MNGSGFPRIDGARGLEWLLRGACSVMFLGHGWLCLAGIMPLRALLWDESLAAGPVRALFGMDWGEWVSSLVVEQRIDAVIRGQGWIFMVLAAASLVPARRRLVPGLLALGTVDLAFLAWLKFHDSGAGLGQFIEHAGQVLLPLVTALVIRAAGPGRPAVLVAQVAVALAFTGHGLFAIGLPSEIPWLNHARPGHFTEMTMLCLGLDSEAATGRILLAAGVLDLVAAVLVFARGQPRGSALVYMVVWGFLTALARPWSYFEPSAAGASLARWVPEMLYRAPHFVLPLFLLLASRRVPAEPAGRRSPVEASATSPSP